MQKRKKVMLVLMASMMVAAAMSQARAEGISTQERLNTQGKIEAAMAGHEEILMSDLDLTEGKIQATMLTKSKEEILNMISVMMSVSEDLQERANNSLIANDTDIQGEFGAFGKLMDLIQQKSEEIANLSENQKEQMVQSYLEAEQAYGLIIRLSEKYQ